MRAMKMILLCLSCLQEVSRIIVRLPIVIAEALMVQIGSQSCRPPSIVVSYSSMLADQRSRGHPFELSRCRKDAHPGFPDAPCSLQLLVVFFLGWAMVYISTYLATFAAWAEVDTKNRPKETNGVLTVAYACRPNFLLPMATF